MAEQWNLEQLRTFVRVVELRSFSAVAREQRKAQSAVSNAIALLEADLGDATIDTAAAIESFDPGSDWQAWHATRVRAGTGG